MRVSRNTDTNLLPSEKKSLTAFLSLYLVFSAIILLFTGFLYYNFQKDLMLQKKREFLQDYAKGFIFRLKKLHRNFSKTHIYPYDAGIRTAIYDSDKVKIFSLLKEPPNLHKALYEKNGEIHFVKEPDEYYLGAKYIVFEVDDDKKWLKNFYKNIALFGAPLFVFVMVVGYFLMRLFLKPMRESLLLLDRFIKDTTHELNTPVSAILANIETLDTANCDEKQKKKILRINIAAKTISNIYQDLTYLILHHKVQKRVENLNLSQIVRDRCEYFKIIANSKRVIFVLDIDENISVAMDKNQAVKLIDNLISNAIKYNKVGGKIYISLKNHELTVKDEGVGIKREKLSEIFERYKRFNSSSGGFGIGLNIVWMIAKENNLRVKVDSKVGQFTEVKVLW